MRSFAFIEFWDRSSWKRENLREKERERERKGEEERWVESWPELILRPVHRFLRYNCGLLIVIHRPN